MPNGKTSTEGCQILNMPNGRTSAEGFCFYIYISRKPVRCTGKLLKIKSKLILIPFTSFVEYVFFFFFGSSKCYRQDL